MMQSLWIFLFGVIAQIIDGSLGMGFGVTCTSLLLTLSMAPALASALVHFTEIFTTFFSGVYHLKFGNVDKSIFYPLVISGVFGGICGAYLSVKIMDISMIKPFISLILLFMGAILIYRNITKKNQMMMMSKKKIVLIGFPAAFIDAIGGGGWGPVATPSLMINGTHPRKAIGTVNLAEFFVTLSISATFLLTLPKIDYLVMIPLILGTMFIAPFAAKITQRIPHDKLAIVVGLLIMILSIRTIVISLM
jgi:uncharacterized membrane protein YfcA